MSSTLVTSTELIAQLAKQRENANWRFRSYVKGQLETGDRDLDLEVRAIADRVASQIDCTSCANCCKTLQPVVDADDIDRLAARFRISAQKFEEQYVMREEFGEMCLHTTPCPFLKNDRCSVYEDRPKACRDYPYLNSEGFRQRLISMIENYAVCPIVFNTLDELKKTTGFLARARRRT